jgi:hypothetical protein
MPLLRSGGETRASWREVRKSGERDGCLSAQPIGRGILDPEARTSARERPGCFETCANPGCRSAGCICGAAARRRSLKGLELLGGLHGGAGGPAVRRELDGRGMPQESHRHRIPLGLVMLEQGWITSGQLRQALDAQKAAGAGAGPLAGAPAGRQRAAGHQGAGAAVELPGAAPGVSRRRGADRLVPRLFVDAFGALPLRVAAGKLLYLGFEDRLDPVLALAIERMTGLRVESGLVQGRCFGPRTRAC